VTAPIIVSATFAPEDHRWLDAQRKAHFPPERNLLEAHLTLFHHLPPSVEAELKQRLRTACRAPRPVAQIAAPYSLGGGVAYRVHSPALAAIRSDLAEAFAGLLTPQDQAGWRPHVTIQNKATAQEAKALLETLQRDFRPRPLAIAGLAAWWYRGGPWEKIGAYNFMS
jgi:2'-5' RNA ligase superfamily